MKLQISFRDMRHERADTAVAVGLVEYPTHAAPREMIAAFRAPFDVRGGGLPEAFIDLKSYRFPEDPYGRGDDYADYDVSGLATERIWRAPDHRFNCEMFLRETRVEPSRSGLAVMAFVGMATFPGGRPVEEASVLQYSMQAGVFAFEGRVGEDLNPEWGAPDMKEKMTGNSLMSFLRQPVWGFGVEPIGLRSAMRLDFIDRFDDYRKLELMRSRSPEEEARYNDLESEMRRSGMTVRDDGYREFLSSMLEMGLLRPTSAPETKQQAADVSRAASEIIRNRLDAGQGMSMR